MTSRTSAALAIWHARLGKSASERAYTAYLVILAIAILGVPVGRIIWLTIVNGETSSFFTSPHAAIHAGLFAAILWSVALLCGPIRGPAVRAPFVSHVLGTSDISRVRAFGGPSIRATLLLMSTLGALAGMIGFSCALHGSSPLSRVAVFTASGITVSALAGFLWLVGQVRPRLATPLAILITVMACAGSIVHLPLWTTPWGWVSLTFPHETAESGSPALAALLSLTVVLIGCSGRLLARLDLTELIKQAARWERTREYSSIFYTQGVTTMYAPRPRIRHRISAISCTDSRLIVFLRRDAVTAERTPGRLAWGIVAVCAASVILVALSLHSPVWLSSAGLRNILGCAAGVLAFAGVGAFSDGLRHAVNVASDFPLYGVSDARLMGFHALFPTIMTVMIILVTVTVIFLVAGSLPPMVFGQALVLGLLSVLTRITTALKGEMPTLLLTPIPSPAGDLMALFRAAWALEGLLLAAVVGLSVTCAPTTIIPVILVAGVIVSITGCRWHRRR